MHVRTYLYLWIDKICTSTSTGTSTVPGTRYLIDWHGFVLKIPRYKFWNELRYVTLQTSISVFMNFFENTEIANRFVIFVWRDFILLFFCPPLSLVPLSTEPQRYRHTWIICIFVRMYVRSFVCNFSRSMTKYFHF